MRVETTSTPEALSHFRHKFSEFEGHQAVEMESPLSAKRIRYLDAGSDVLQGQFQAARGLLETVDTLNMVRVNFQCFSLLSANDK